MSEKKSMIEIWEEYLKNMKEREWVAKIQEDYPFMRRDRSGDKDNLYYMFGFDCNEGWCQIIRDACDAIVKRYAEDGIAPEDIDFIPSQIKEKYGTLRWYYEYLDTPSGIAAFDMINAGVSIRFKPKSENADEKTKRLREDIDKIIEEAEEKSESICEWCGAPGILRDDRAEGNFWLLTLCDSCHDKRLEANREQVVKEGNEQLTSAVLYPKPTEDPIKPSDYIWESDIDTDFEDN